MHERRQSKMTLNHQQFQMPSNVLVQELDGEAVLLHAGSGKYFGLDKMGLTIWKTLLESNSTESACQLLLSQYEVDEDKLARDVNELIEKLVLNQLLERRS